MSKHHSETETKTGSAPRYWLSLEQVENPAAFDAGGEFNATPVREGFEKEGLERRDFLKIMGASALMASLAGCTRRPVQKIVPYVNNPEEIVPGVPNFYSSACPETGYGLVVKTREGRPIKVDGNADHPVNRGALNARGQAFVHDLYDPDRLRAPRIDGKDSDWAGFDEAVKKALSAAGKGNVALVTGTVMSPTLKSLIGKLGIRHVMVDSVSADDVLEGQAQSYGSRVFPRYRIDKANVIVSIDADFLDTWGSSVEYTNQFAKRRRLDGGNEQNRLIAFESMMRLTGQNADERFAIRPQDQIWVALGLAAEVARLLGKSQPELAGISAAAVAERTGIKAEVFAGIAKELVKERGRSLVLAGGNVAKGANAVALQNAVNFLNSALGNEGETVDATLSPSNQFQGSFADFQRLVRDMKNGAVKAVIVQGVNPAYQFPAELGFAEAAKASTVIYMGRYADETAALAKFVAAESHPFETWGDVSAQRDVYSIVQPTLRPLWQTKSLLEALADWAPALGAGAGGANAYELVQNTWKELQKKYSAVGDFLKFWEDTLQSGVFDPAAAKRKGSASARGFKGEALRAAASAAQAAKAPVAGEFTLALYHSTAMGDGSQANNALLQELPDPVTKNTWGNYLSMSPETAKQLGVDDGQFVKVSGGGHEVTMTVHRQPGLKTGVVAAALGYGRKLAGRVGNEVGVDLTAFAKLAAHGLDYVVGVSVAKAAGSEHIPCTQGHHTLEGREIVFDTTLEEYKKNPKAGIVRETPDPISIWSKHEYPGYKWGMVVDLNSCTGCSACVVSCSVENNVPAVGKDQVSKRREMQWIRIDRYYTGDTENPEVVFQPMLCQHCDNAPCETVCPVLATTHSTEGLNQMTYNRCVGTKYCSNNCPYKVRRFNWFENNAPLNAPMEHPIPMMKNPEVTLRSRGVMEKCTFCVQRIEKAKSDAKSHGRRVEDKDLRTACQDACPTDAITFGDMNNPESAVAKLRQNPRGYISLEELNARPAVMYLTKVRNRAPVKFGPGEESHGEHHG